ncbi:hypothetical protein [Salinibaculum rarum]|uniref:hypothetical protein n=1 Tax=Salinibaculum rarum TaxID=3058903 RepID=UPI00265EFFCD|nr:hypothetical protein [Salinibaculum sp. KK48]
MGDALDHSGNSKVCQHPYNSVAEMHLQVTLDAKDDLREDINVSADVCEECGRVLAFNGLDALPLTRINEQLSNDDAENCMHPYEETTETTLRLAQPGEMRLRNPPTISECVLCTNCNQIIDATTRKLTP